MAPFKRTTLPAVYSNGQTFGRPSQYRPEYCQLVIDKMAEGISLTAFAGFLRVSTNTIYEWIRAHPDFADAVSRANPSRVLWWELKLMRSRKGAETTAATFALRNAAPTEWKDIRNVQHDHNVRVETLSDAQLYQIAAGNPHADGVTIDGECEDIETR